MRIRIVTIVCFFLVSLTLTAQKKELSQARAYIKSGDYAKAEKLMTGLLESNAANRENKDIYYIWYQSVRKQYEAANEKLYLKQAYDTASFFGLTRQMYAITESLDSLDVRPDEKGRIRPKYRRDHAAAMNLLRPNLYNGGIYHLRKTAYAEAFLFFDAYIDAARQPLFTGFNYEQSDNRMPAAAYWATYCGHKLQDTDMTMKYAQLALTDTAKAEYTLQYICEAYHRSHSDSLYLATLYQGFSRFPEHPYFFPRLEDFLTAHSQNEAALDVANRALEINPSSQLFLLAKSLSLLNLDRYDECVEVSEKLIAVNDSLPEPYYNVATAYLNQALELEKQNDPRKNRPLLTHLYDAARPYMEAYRKLTPDDDARWAPALYRIYFNLNMGKQFEEIDRLMKKK